MVRWDRLTPRKLMSRILPVHAKFPMTLGTAMSETADLNVREQIVRIDRALAEGHKFSADNQKLAEEALKLTAEQRKLGAEQLKFGAEQQKFYEEALKLRRDRGLAPWLAVIAISGGVGGIIAGVTSILHLFGKIP